METGKAPHVSKGTRWKICSFFPFLFSVPVYESFSAMLLCSECVNVGVCIPGGPTFDWESSDLAEPANVAQFTWPCPRPQPSPFYL